MPDWLVALIVLIVVVAAIALLVWWWMNYRTRPAVSTAPAASTSSPVAPAVAPPVGPYGPGSAAPLAGGAAPQGFTIKGNADSMLYHTPESPYYGRTIAEVWFRTAEDAEKAGFKAWNR